MMDPAAENRPPVPPGAAEEQARSRSEAEAYDRLDSWTIKFVILLASSSLLWLGWDFYKTKVWGGALRERMEYVNNRIAQHDARHPEDLLERSLAVYNPLYGSEEFRRPAECRLVFRIQPVDPERAAQRVPSSIAFALDNMDAGGTEVLEDAVILRRRATGQPIPILLPGSDEVPDTAACSSRRDRIFEEGYIRENPECFPHGVLDSLKIQVAQPEGVARVFAEMIASCGGATDLSAAY